MNKKTLFVCPACKGELKQNENVMVCENGHSFDIAKQGYVHLLMPNKMHSKIPGDSKQMVDSRRSFLESGYYNIFSDKLCEIVGKYMKNSQSSVILDAGCGEGYYTSRLKTCMPKAQVSGFDISKFAVKSAAGKYKEIDFAVASIFDIPVKNESAHCVINIFAPIVEKEFSRVLKKDGILVIAVPGERHLYELKEILYDKPYENERKDTDYEGFQFVERVTVKGKTYLDSKEMIWNLFSMTPYFWKTEISGSERLKETEKLSTEIHFDFLIYKKA